MQSINQKYITVIFSSGNTTYKEVWFIIYHDLSTIPMYKTNKQYKVPHWYELWYRITLTNE